MGENDLQMHPKLKDFLYPRRIWVYGGDDRDGERLDAIATFAEGRELDGRQLLTWLECQQMVGRESVKFNDSTAPHINIDGLICAIAGKHALNCRGVWGDDDARQTK